MPLTDQDLRRERSHDAFLPLFCFGSSPVYKTGGYNHVTAG